MTQTTIVLNPKRTEYAAEKAAKKTMTVAQMIEALKQFIENVLAAAGFLVLMYTLLSLPGY